MVIFEDMNIEQWIDIKYRNVKPNMYQVSSLGNVRRKDTFNHIAICKSEKGYLMVALMCTDNKQNTFKLHRVVGCCWYGDLSDKGLELNHKDGNKENCSIWNLEWISHLDNIRHAYKNNLVPVAMGVDHYNSKYSEDVIRLICSMAEYGLKGKDIKRILRKASWNIPITLIDDLMGRRSWKHIVNEFNY